MVPGTFPYSSNFTQYQVGYDYYEHHHVVVSWCENNTIHNIAIPLTTTGYSMLHKKKIETTILTQLDR